MTASLVVIAALAVGVIVLVIRDRRREGRDLYLEAVREDNANQVRWAQSQGWPYNDDGSAP